MKQTTGPAASARAAAIMYANGPPAESVDRMELASPVSTIDLPSLVPQVTSNHRFKMALSLYKVQQNIYLLDFQRIEGSVLGFMKLCALVIAELKNLSAANRALAAQQQHHHLQQQQQQQQQHQELGVKPA